MAQKKSKVSGKKYKDIDASPVKSFFVDMLTRDIALEDAILDLLDNCVDGIQRSVKKLKKKLPYDGYHANIKFDKDGFSIKDNCGGIPWSLHNYAFRMGRANPKIDKGLMTVGVYGIGMKRAIFKIGKNCVIRTQDKSDSYEVTISEEWMKSNDWILPVIKAKRIGENGTKIEITKITKDISKQFGGQSFPEKLKEMISVNYAYIIERGFRVKVNGLKIEPKSTALKFAKAGKKKDNIIAPFIYKAQHNGVNIFLAVGFTSPLVGEDQTDQENYKSKYTAKNAGWTIICNDRVVVHCDKTELTGWGSAGVPLFHNQFISIAGMVEFSSNDAAKLPTTTTKRGIDASSTLFLHIRDKMIEGMKIFTNYTNQWKGEYSEQSKKEIDSVPVLPLSKIKEKTQSVKMSKTKPRGSSGVSGSQYKPVLPRPRDKKVSSGKQRISFLRNNNAIRLVSDYIYGKKNISPNKVGNECFEIILDKARR